jgi:hypothetical protein
MTILLWQKPLTQVVRQIVQRDNGAWFDPSDLSTLFQDAAGTIPVTAVGQPVGKMLDKSGNGYHATQSITAYRPALMQDIYGYYYLAFDGIDNYMSLGDVFDVDKNGLSMIAAATVSGGARHPIAGKSIASIYPGRYFLGAESDSFALVGQGSLVSTIAYTPVIGASTVYNMTLSAGSSHRMSLRVNGTLIGDVPTPLPEASNTSLDFMIGQYPVSYGYLNGRNYGLIVTAKALSVGQAAICERYLGRKSGVQL